MNIYILQGGAWVKLDIAKPPTNYHSIKLYDDNLSYIGIGYYKRLSR